MVSYMQRVFAALLMLGLYHVLLQQFASVDTAPAASIRPCRNGKAAAATADGITSMTTAHAARRPGRAWRPPVWSNIEANEQASMIFGDADPAKTTLHFTFGSASMMQFFRNWLHFVRKVGIGPVVIGAADKQMYVACTAEEIAAIAIAPGLDVWNYTRRGNVSTVVQEGHSEWKYYRHHKSSFLEIGLVKAAFLWELLALGFDVLISDLDIVWLSPRWEPWMTYRHEATYPPYREAALMAMADVLVSTDELDEAYDGFGSWERYPFGVGWGRRSELNTGVLFFRATNGSKAFVQAWRLAMLAKRNVAYTNDQFVFCAMVREASMEPVASSAQHLQAWRGSLAAHGLLRETVLSSISPSTRDVYISGASNKNTLPCLPEQGCAPTRFTLATLPLRGFTGGHTWFMQHAYNFDGHAQPHTSVLTVHFTFQYSDTPDFPHGKRQRAREAALWTADPDSYYTEGRFLKLVGPLYTAKQRADIERRWPEWSPQRHMRIDAIQRAAVRDALALSVALNATLIMPKLVCTCDRYWGFLENCRMPTGPQDMPLPFHCPQDALFEIKRWNDLGVRFRESNFLEHHRVPESLKAAAVRVIVHKDATIPAPHSADASFTAVLRPGTPMSAVGAAVDAVQPSAQLVEIGSADIRRLCKWLGSSAANARFNKVAKYVLTESARYCPVEDHSHKVANVPKWNWQNPFTAYNCTWGFHHPTPYPEPSPGGRPPCGGGEEGVALVERGDSTTCPRAMLCDWNTLPDGNDNGKRISRCNLEGYGGVDYSTFGEQVKATLASMPGGRCPYPPLDVPGPGAGFDAEMRWLGRGSATHGHGGE